MHTKLIFRKLAVAQAVLILPGPAEPGMPVPHTRLTSTKRFTNLNLSRRKKNQAVLCSDY